MLRNQKCSFSSLELIFFRESVSIFSKTFVERFSHRIILIPRLNEAMIKRELQDLFRSERWEMFSGKLKSSRNYYISLAVQVCGDTNKNRRVWSAETNYPNLPRGNSCTHQRPSLSALNMRSNACCHCTRRWWKNTDKQQHREIHLHPLKHCFPCFCVASRPRCVANPTHRVQTKSKPYPLLSKSSSLDDFH